MFNIERQKQIIKLLEKEGKFISVKQLCDVLYASESSIRRDLMHLEKKGVVRRSYGGAELVNEFTSITTFNHRSHINVNEKRIMAKKALSLINEGDVIFLDQSSTVLYLAYELLSKTNVTVVTNNIEVISLLANSQLTVISSGGTVGRDNRSCLLGGEAQKTFENVFATKLFFSTNSISNDGIISDCSIDEVSVRQPMLKNAKSKIYMCDSSKLGNKSVYVQCNVNDLDYVIVDDVTKFNIPTKDSLRVL